MPRVSVVIVSWNTRNLLERCLISVYRSRLASAELEVLVVDNGSSDGSPEMVAERFPETLLITSSRNLGFARANNLAMQQATGDYLLLLNSDAELLGDALQRLVQCADRHPAVAVVGPQLLNPDGTVQSSRRGFPTITTAFLESTVLQRWLPRHRALQRYYLLHRGDQEMQEVDWLVGACLLVRRTAVQEAGSLDEDYFMYSEELDWCRRFAEAGWRSLYCPEARVIHYGGQSSEQDLFHRHVRFQYSKCRYFEKYHGRPFALILRTFLLGNYLFLLLEDVAKLPFPRKRAMRARRVSMLARVVAWHLGWLLRPGAVRQCP